RPLADGDHVEFGGAERELPAVAAAGAETDRTQPLPLNGGLKLEECHRREQVGEALLRLCSAVGLRLRGGVGEELGSALAGEQVGGKTDEAGASDTPRHVLDMVHQAAVFV